MKSPWILAAAVGALVVSCRYTSEPNGSDGLGASEMQAGGKAERVLPKDAIPAIFDPQFVSVAEAGMPDDAEVIGVIVKGEAKAYSINLLDGHEIVNDEIQGVKFAVTW